MRVLQAIYVFLAWFGWAVIALVINVAWMAFSFAPLFVVEGTLYQAADWLGFVSPSGRSPLIAWLALPLVYGGWPYLLLWLTRRTVMLNDAIYWLNALFLGLVVFLGVGVWFGIGEPGSGYVLFGYDASAQGLTVWSLWIATGAVSLGSALFIFRRRYRLLRKEVRDSALNEVAGHA